MRILLLGLIMGGLLLDMPGHCSLGFGNGAATTKIEKEFKNIRLLGKFANCTNPTTYEKLSPIKKQRCPKIIDEGCGQFCQQDKIDAWPALLKNPCARYCRRNDKGALAIPPTL